MSYEISYLTCEILMKGPFCDRKVKRKRNPEIFNCPELLEE